MTSKQALAVADKLLKDIHKQWSGGKFQAIHTKELLGNFTRVVESIREDCSQSPEAEALPHVVNMLAKVTDGITLINAMIFVLLPDIADPWTVLLYVENSDLSVREFAKLLMQLQKTLYEANLLARANAAQTTKDAVPGPDFVFFRLQVSHPKYAWPFIQERLAAFNFLDHSFIVYEDKRRENDGGYCLLHPMPSDPLRTFEQCLARVEDYCHRNGL